jgi:hypothetical protein
MEEEIGVLCSGKRNLADREGQHSEFEERDIGSALQIGGILCIVRKEKEKDPHLSPKEGHPLHTKSPTQARPYVEPTTLCASPRSEVISETLL